ncbi:unnamed protein product, partial [Amoebophrya sp. A25]
DESDDEEDCGTSKILRGRPENDKTTCAQEKSSKKFGSFTDKASCDQSEVNEDEPSKTKTSSTCFNNLSSSSTSSSTPGQPQATSTTASKSPHSGLLNLKGTSKREILLRRADFIFWSPPRYGRAGPLSKRKKSLSAELVAAGEELCSLQALEDIGITTERYISTSNRRDRVRDTNSTFNDNTRGGNRN